MMKYWFDWFSIFDRMLRESAKISTYSMVAIGIIGTVAHCVYGALWLYVTPLEHENLWLRVVGAISCFGLLINKNWPKSWKKFLPWYWFSVVSYTLPFFATFQLLGSNYSLLRSMLEVTMVFFVIAIFSKPMIALINMIIGVVAAIFAAYLIIPNFNSLNHTLLLSIHLQVMIYTLVGGFIFSRSNLRGLLAQEKLETLKAHTGSIAQELRTPLNQLRRRMEDISQRLPHPQPGEPSQSISTQDLQAIHRHVSKGKFTVDRGVHVIEMTLDEIASKPVDKAVVRYLLASTVTQKAVDEYAYPSLNERSRVSITVLQDFIFKGDETKYLFMLFNLLKNAIFYFKDFPYAHVKIIVDNYTVEVKDTGPGMQPEVLARAFEPFHSEGKQGSTGLGLSFCKRTMISFGGDIVCDSVPQEYTRFSICFPPLDSEELAAHEMGVMKQAVGLFKGKRILVVDDMASLRKEARGMLAPLEALIDEAGDGEDALKQLALQRYDAMLLDLNMPLLDGYATADKIRRGHIPGYEQLTIVAYSSDPPDLARAKLERMGVNAFVAKGSPVLELIETLCRAHTASECVEKALPASPKLSGKTVLLVDDEAFSRKYLRALLQKCDLRVVEASSGRDALNLLNGSTPIDGVVTDINMHGLTGLDFARAMRALPRPIGALPIIAVSAHSDQAMFAAAQEAGINDFLVKPVKPVEFNNKLEQLLLAEPDKTKQSPALQQGGADEGGEAERAPHLLDTAQLTKMRQIGMLDGDLSDGLRDMQAKLDVLTGHVATNDFRQALALMHTLVGLAGQMGAHAFHKELRARYIFTMEAGKWPGDGTWLAKLRELFSETERLIKARLTA